MPVDGVSRGTVDAYTPARSAQQVLYQIGPAGFLAQQHTIKLTESGGAYLLVDSFRVEAS
ncbi:hypothetical protein [Catenulispora subtropica]|uniref:Uncharacterized protein n=1 Tax=Catenulispora subtropica TaxID=450798 RepID=A0ABN2QTP2_9ACTN